MFDIFSGGKGKQRGSREGGGPEKAGEGSMPNNLMNVSVGESQHREQFFEL